MRKIQFFYIFLSRLSKREKAIFYVTATFLVLMALDRAILYPTFSKMDTLDSEIKTKQVNINRDLRMLSQKNRILKEVAKYGSYLNKPQSEEEGVTTLLKEVESLANKSSLYIVDMKPAGLKIDEKKSQRYAVNLNCEGQMEQIMDFMYNVENSRKFLTIEKYQISPKTKLSSVVNCTMTIVKIVIP